jgi:putative ABC transport system permease protein
LLILTVAALPLEEMKDVVGTPELNPLVALITVVILSTIGFVAGFFPARRAARINVIDCLRY